MKIILRINCYDCPRRSYIDDILQQYQILLSKQDVSFVLSHSKWQFDTVIQPLEDENFVTVKNPWSYELHTVWNLIWCPHDVDSCIRKASTSTLHFISCESFEWKPYKWTFQDISDRTRHIQNHTSRGQTNPCILFCTINMPKADSLVCSNEAYLVDINEKL